MGGGGGGGATARAIAAWGNALGWEGCKEPCAPMRVAVPSRSHASAARARRERDNAASAC